MSGIPFHEEAKNCRRQATSYVGLPEGALLLRVAEEFEKLNPEHRSETGSLAAEAREAEKASQR